jgi:Doublecortin
MSDASPQEPSADDVEPTATNSPRKSAVVRAKSAVDISVAASDSDQENNGDGGADDSRTTYWGYRKQRMDDDPPVAMTKPEKELDSVAGRRPVNNLSYWRARRVVFYKNGDPYTPGVEFRFKPTRDIMSMEALLDKVSLRVDLPCGARYIFSTTGERLTHLEQLDDGGSYVVSSYKIFKVFFDAVQLIDGEGRRCAVRFVACAFVQALECPRVVCLVFGVSGCGKFNFFGIFLYFILLEWFHSFC